MQVTVNTSKRAAYTFTVRAPQQNGITAPKRVGMISYAWDLFDSATGHIYAAQVALIAEKTGLNTENLAIELRRWKRFNGIQTGARLQRVTH